MNIVIGFGPSLGLALWPRAKPIKIHCFQPAEFVNLPHEKVYNCVVTCLNILVLSPVVGEWVYHYLFCQGKEYSNGSSPKKNVPKSVLMIMWPNLNL